MKKISSIFGWNKKKAEEPEPVATKSKKMSAKKVVPKKGAKAAKVAEVEPKKKGWW